MPHAIEMKDGKILTPFGIRDLLEAMSDYNKKVWYFKYASATKCAEQVVEDER